MLHQATPSTPNHLPNLFLFELAGLSFAPSSPSATARASLPIELRRRVVGVPASAWIELLRRRGDRCGRPVERGRHAVAPASCGSGLDATSPAPPRVW